MSAAPTKLVNILTKTVSPTEPWKMPIKKLPVVEITGFQAAKDYTCGGTSIQRCSGISDRPTFWKNGIESRGPEIVPMLIAESARTKYHTMGYSRINAAYEGLEQSPNVNNQRVYYRRH